MSVLLALLLLQAAPGQSTPDARAEAARLFELGTALAAEGDTTGAVAAFEGARATGWTSAAVEHDLGTLALARGDIGRARLHLERAARLGPSAATAQNLRLVRERADAPAPTAAERLWRRLVATAGVGGLVVLALLLTYVAAALAGLVRQRGGRGLRAGAWALGAIAAIAVLAAVGALAEASRAVGVVLVESDVREAPSPEADGTGRLAPGQTLTLGGKTGGWRHVRTGGAEGWVPAEAVERL